ncbi:cysteine hydrolase family protein [Acidocella aromatica]|uniref:Nicotinamidase-related amidase n=1 Tax=Acidocella aromatica TaxID=1303579 RepID=A0A840VC16_9PROT|nr:isochorismatase family cysteine hydrolase [Acidocella aromatica]MBB5373323.1 nicotinamidase-related amidase [Acidocella aromatica]
MRISAKPYDWPHDDSLRPETTALIIIDVQRDFTDPRGYIASLGYDTAPARALIPGIAALREAASAWGALIVHTREGHRPDLADLPPQKAWRSARLGPGIGAPGALRRFLVRGEPGWEMVPELRRRPGEVVIDKPGYSAFAATDLALILAVRGIRHLIICGLTTDVCVHSTLRDAVDRGFECLVAGDLCAATEEENHRAALATIATEGGIFGAVARAAEIQLKLAR